MSTTPKTTEGREKFGSRIGFILISAGCAIGLGNVWRFPYVCGEYGGAAFVLLYLVFLMILGLPILVMEYAVGRASQKSCARSYNILEPEGTKWHWYKWFAFAGNFILMMFYTTVAGWMIAYAFKMATGQLTGLGTSASASASGAAEQAFTALLADPFQMLFWMVIICGIGFFIVGLGLQNGVERVTKVMMACLFVAIVILAINSVMLPGAHAGLEFYLMPDFGKMIENGFGDAVYAAMGQAFFTLSIGASGMAIFGSYIGRDRRLTGEAASVAGLSTLISLLAGLIIFPRLLRLWRFTRFGPQPGVRHAAERIRSNVGRPAVGHAVLHFYELRRAFHRHWRVRKHRGVLHGPMGRLAPLGRGDQRRAHHRAFGAVHSGLQRVAGSTIPRHR